MLLIPTLNSLGTGANFPDYVGGPAREGGSGNTGIFISNISETDNGKNYNGLYFNDDWKVSQKLTINLGLRWDFFGLVYEHYANQANFVPGGPPTGSPMYLIPPGKNSAFLASPPTCTPTSTSFQCLLIKDGIALDITNKYGKGLGNSQKTNFAPRFGFAYQVNPKLVARGGFGIFYAFPDSNTINNTVATVPFIATSTVFNDRPSARPTRTWADFFLGQPNVSPNTTGQVCAFGFVAKSCATPDVDSVHHGRKPDIPISGDSFAVVPGRLRDFTRPTLGGVSEFQQCHCNPAARCSPEAVHPIS